MFSFLCWWPNSSLVILSKSLVLKTESLLVVYSFFLSDPRSRSRSQSKGNSPGLWTVNDYVTTGKCWLVTLRWIIIWHVLTTNLNQVSVSWTSTSATGRRKPTRSDREKSRFWLLIPRIQNHESMKPHRLLWSHEGNRMSCKLHF